MVLHDSSVTPDSGLLSSLLALHRSFLHERETGLPRALAQVLAASCAHAGCTEGFIGELVINGRGSSLRTWAHQGSTWSREVHACSANEGDATPKGPLDVLTRAVESAQPVWVDEPLLDLRSRGRLTPEETWIPNLLAIPCRGETRVWGICAFSHRDQGFPVDVVEMLEVVAASVASVFEALQWGREQRKLLNEARQALQQERNAASRTRDLFTVLSREVRTPLNGVVGLAHLLATGPALERQRNSLDALQFAATSLSQLVNDTCDFASIDAGDFELHEKVVDLGPMLVELVRSHESMASIRGIELFLDAEALPCACMLDPIRLLQVLNHLIDNAIKFTNRGNVTVTVSVVEQHFLFSVEDTGAGIPEDRQEVIFESFARQHREDERVYRGAGFGLAIARRLVEKLGGDLRVHSRMGEGARFWFSIPLREASQAEVIAAASVSTPGLPRIGRERELRVLVVDDVPLNVKVTARILESFGATVRTAGSGYDALQMLSGSSFDVVLLDLHMPDMDGFETWNHIRAREVRAAVYAVSADTLSKTAARVRASGMLDLLPKPMAPAVLRQLVSKHAAFPSPGA